MMWIGRDQPAEVDETLLSKNSRSFPHWGLVLLNPRQDGSGDYAFVRYPVRGFRPAQADMMHLDLWSEAGENLLIDGGTFSYADPAGVEEFSTIRAHNTVVFDGGEPMRRLSRFLYADWLSAYDVSPVKQGKDEVSWRASYRDYRGNKHTRAVTAEAGTWQVTDTFSGRGESAALRWHLPVQSYSASPTRFEGEDLSIQVQVVGGNDFAVERGWTSPTYGHRREALTVVLISPSEDGVFGSSIVVKAR